MKVCRDLVDRKVTLIVREDVPLDQINVALSLQLEGRHRLYGGDFGERVMPMFLCSEPSYSFDISWAEASAR
jgi:hypothetical protein